MRIPIHQLDAFAEGPFTGNPAAVCPLGEWLPDAFLQSIAAENNLSETAFLVGGDGVYDLRWFTPAVEVDLCGHATLASGAVVMNDLEPGRTAVRFRTRMAGDLGVERRGDLYALDFPAQPPRPIPAPPGLAAALGAVPLEVHAASQVVALLGDEEAVLALRPDMERVRALPFHGLVATAPGRTCDFVSRYFVPGSGIPEDPVTGSTHCVLVPFWAARLGKNVLRARQVSARGGALACELRGERVSMAGRVEPYLKGFIEVPG